MGMNDIFEPAKADFTQLADDKTLYVKNVEQMININIRTQTTQQLKSNWGCSFWDGLGWLHGLFEVMAFGGKLWEASNNFEK